MVSVETLSFFAASFAESQTVTLTRFTGLVASEVFFTPFLFGCDLHVAPVLPYGPKDFCKNQGLLVAFCVALGLTIWQPLSVEFFDVH